MESLGGVLGGLEDVWGGAEAPLGAYKRRLERSKRTSKTVLNDHRGQQGPQMDPQRGSKRGPKSSLAKNAEIMKSRTQYIGFEGFSRSQGLILGTKMGSKIDVNFERRFFHETHSRCSGGSFCRIKRVEVGNKNGAKIEQKMRSTKEGNLSSIFDRFWSI